MYNIIRFYEDYLYPYSRELDIYCTFNEFPNPLLYVMSRLKDNMLTFLVFNNDDKLYFRQYYSTLFNNVNEVVSQFINREVIISYDGIVGGFEVDSLIQIIYPNINLSNLYHKRRLYYE